MRRRRSREPAGDPGEPLWASVSAELAEPLAEELSGRLAAGSLGAQLLPLLDGGRCRLTLYGEISGAGALRDGLVRELRSLGVDPASCSVELREIADGRWVERYQASLVPFPLGRAFVVDPRGGPPAADRSRRSLVLVPGRAFGTGEHPTTRLCVELLEDLVRPGSRWLDLGCGTGILAMVAAHRGAREVLAVDDDPEAVAVARETVGRNGLSGTIGVARGSLAEAGGGWDGVVANVHAALLCNEARAIGERLARRGRLVGSGLLCEESAAVVSALAGAGLHTQRRESDGEWAAIVAGRRGSAEAGDG